MSNIGLTEWEVDEIRKERMSNNPPDKIVELTQEQYDFLLRNCDSNIGFGLAALQQTQDRRSALQLVDLLEQFKGIKAALEKAK